MTSPPNATPSRPTLLAIGLLCTGTWALSHRYLGIFHDANIYTLQALSHLSGSLRQDVFLKYGSQDRFTLFSPIYARAIQALGVEPAAALLTGLSQAALIAGAFALARALMPSYFALFGVATLIALPGDYGADRIFTCIEPFLTPRMLAEALTLGGIAAALTSRRLVAGLLILLAALLHPVMAAAGIATLFCLEVVPRHPRMAAALCLAGVALITLLTLINPIGSLVQFDPQWLALIESRSPSLFLANWGLDDWSRAAVPLATLALGSDVLRNDKARTLSRATLIAVLGGFALTGIACDLLHLVLFTQLQPWRWGWLGTVVAAVLLPTLLGTLWVRDSAGRSSALSLIAAWIFASNPYAIAAATAAVAVPALLQRLKPNEVRWVLWGACALLAIAVVWRVASNLQFTDAHYLDLRTPLWIRRSMSFVHDGTAPLALMALVWWLGRSPHGRPGIVILCLLTAAGCCALLPQTWAAWTTRDYPPQRIADFGAMRAIIPAGTAVFWPESPVATWLLLDRPSYLSGMQTVGMVFSRDSALELQRRTRRLAATIAPAAFLDFNSAGPGLELSPTQLEQACASGAFEFMVTATDLGEEPLAAVQSAAAPTAKKIRLYRCRGS